MSIMSRLPSIATTYLERPRTAAARSNWDTPFVVQPSNQPLSGKVTPLYQVMALIYAPPGDTAGGLLSSVDYSTSSSTGTTVSTSQAFTDGYKVSGGVIGSLTGSFSASTTTTNSQAVTISKTSTLDIHVDGNTTVDGIDHDEDAFYLWLNPVMYVQMDGQRGIAWRLGLPDDQPNVSMTIQHVSVAQLSGRESMDPATKKALDNAGLDKNDYNTILALNRFPPTPRRSMRSATGWSTRPTCRSKSKSGAAVKRKPTP